MIALALFLLFQVALPDATPRPLGSPAPTKVTPPCISANGEYSPSENCDHWIGLWLSIWGLTSPPAAPHVPSAIDATQCRGEVCLHVEYPACDLTSLAGDCSGLFEEGVDLDWADPVAQLLNATQPEQKLAKSMADNDWDCKISDTHISCVKRIGHD